MDFGTAISTVFSKYADFTGRARRSEYWFWVLFFFLVYVGFLVLGAVIGTSAIIVLPVLAFLVPNLAISVRRLHDTGKSGWFVLIGLIPLVGAILLIVWTATDGTPGPNQYGADPKGADAPGHGAPGYGAPGAPAV